METVREDGSDDETSIFPHGSVERERGWLRYRHSLGYLFPARPYFSQGGVSRVDQAGCFSLVTYWWVFTYLWSSYRGLIPNDPGWSCSIYDSANANVSRLEYLWKEELSDCGPGRAPSLVRVVLRFIRTRIIVCCFIFFFCLAFGFIGPACLVRRLIEYAEDRDDRLSYGLSLVLGLFMVELFRVLSYGATWAISYRTGIRVRGAVLGLLFKKVMLAGAIGQTGVGEIINVYANDGQRIFDAATFLPLVLMGPAVLVGGLIYLLTLLGPWSLLGVAVFVLFDLVQASLGKTIVKYRKLAVAQTEARVRVMNEIVQCIGLIKTNAWEYPFMDKADKVRREEMGYLRRVGYAQSLAVAAGPVVPVVATIITVLAYVLANDTPISPSQAFTAITVFFVMVFGIRMIPYGMRYCAEALVALRNIQKYYTMETISADRPPVQNKAHCLVLENARFAYHQRDEEKEGVAVLSNVNLTLDKKELVGVCGPVGAGKSSLLRAIVGELVQRDGAVHLSGSLAYCPQEPWLFNATLRDNILFGEQFDDTKYYRVLYACGLTTDVNNMTAGDQTEVGERGVTLSGGQKCRVALARALYSDRDVYLLDDALAPLDVTVAQRVFEYAIRGVLVTKSVLLVTTDPQYLSKCDRVVLVNDGGIADEGTYQALLTRSDQFAALCRAWTTTPPKKGDTIEAVLNASPVQESEEMEYTPGAITGADSLFDIPSASDGRTTEDEEDLGLNSVATRVYLQYGRAMGGPCVLLLLLLALAGNAASSVFASGWLAVWLKDSQRRADHSNGSFGSMVDDPLLSYYATVYGATILLLVFTSIVKAVAFVNMSLKASSSLHGAMFDRVMHGSMTWFDSTPAGRILNRFSRDTDEMDTKIPFSLETFLQNIFQILAYLLVIAVVFPYFLLVAVPLGLLFAVLVACFRAGIRSLKRSENISRSPLFAHITSSIQGRSSILAYGGMKRANERLNQLLDGNSGAMFMFQSAMRWLAVWLDLLVVLVTLVTSLLIVLLSGSVAPAYAAMALAFSIQMSGIFQFAVRMHAEFEAKMTSVERIQFYIENVEQEREWYNPHSPVAFDWPQAGRISFRDVTLKYRENAAAALKGVTLDVKAQEKVGVVGRTGSGKSSLGSALLGLYPLTGGSVCIDGVDIGRTGLHELRTRISAIPQDPVLFAGTVRFNLDPVNVRSDDELWAALDKAHLKPLIASTEEGLNWEIVEGGKNMSCGQRQLMCMARALLRHVRIIILDEATSSLDGQTDDTVQRCLDQCFQECTKLVIAHRLSSVIGSDKILYLDNGKVVEYDAVHTLRRDPQSRFFRDCWAAQMDRNKEDTENVVNT